MTKYQYNFGQIHDDGTIIPQGSNDSYGRWDALPADIYRLGIEPIGMMQSTYAFYPHKEKDKLLKFNSGSVREVIEKVDGFLSDHTVNIFKEMGLCHKLGIILHGPPGTGKTCAATLAMKELVDKYKAVCLDITTTGLNVALGAVDVIRKYQSNPIVLFVDEIEVDIAHNGYAYLPFLDGNKSVDGLILMGCTNFLEKIEDRIKYRKSRIKHLIEVSSLPEEVYREYIVSKLPEGTAKALVDKFVFLSVEKKLTIDQLKNALIDYRVDRVKITKAINDAAKTERIVEVEEENDKDDIGGEDDC